MITKNDWLTPILSLEKNNNLNKRVEEKKERV